MLVRTVKNVFREIARVGIEENNER